MELGDSADAFDGRYLLPLLHDGQTKAGIHAVTVHQNRAGPALAQPAAFFCAGQVERVSQAVQQRRVHVHVRQAVLHHR